VKLVESHDFFQLCYPQQSTVIVKLKGISYFLDSKLLSRNLIVKKGNEGYVAGHWAATKIAPSIEFYGQVASSQ
jgi:hypothetical protein